MTNHHFVGLDNADTKCDYLEDRLAVCATGGAIPMRELYTTNGLIQFPIDCFLGITARTPHFRRADVSDRLLVFKLRRWAEGSMRPEAEVKEEVLGNRDQLMTHLLYQLQKVVVALAQPETTPFRTNLRMADFAKLCVRLAEQEGRREEVEALLNKLVLGQNFTKEGDAFYDLLSEWLEKGDNLGRFVCAKTLFTELEGIARHNNVTVGCDSSRGLPSRLKKVGSDYSATLKIETKKTSENQTSYSFSVIQTPPPISGH